jgi:hypothetical protein
LDKLGFKKKRIPLPIATDGLHTLFGLKNAHIWTCFEWRNEKVGNLKDVEVLLKGGEKGNG